MKQRPARTFVAWTITPFVILLFAYPNYCDRCSYRDVARLFAQKDTALVPPCCAKKSQPDGSGKKGGKSGGGTHVRYSYCLVKTIPSIAGSRDVLREIRLALAQAHFVPDERSAVRLAVVPDHKDCRGPPA